MHRRRSLLLILPFLPFRFTIHAIPVFLSPTASSLSAAPSYTFSEYVSNCRFNNSIFFFKAISSLLQSIFCAFIRLHISSFDSISLRLTLQSHLHVFPFLTKPFHNQLLLKCGLRLTIPNHLGGYLHFYTLVKRCIVANYLPTITTETDPNLHLQYLFVGIFYNNIYCAIGRVSFRTQSFLLPRLDFLHRPLGSKHRLKLLTVTPDFSSFKFH